MLVPSRLLGRLLFSFHLPGAPAAVESTTMEITAAILLLSGLNCLQYGEAVNNFDVTECLNHCAIPKYYFPLCGSDGHTYSNPEDLACHQKCENPDLTIDHEGACEKMKTNQKKTEIDVIECLSHCVISWYYFPVCGSDGLTYSNPEELACHQKCENPDLTINHEGICQEVKINKMKNEIDVTECLSHCVIPLYYFPVCGSDGHTYSNPEELACHQKCGKPELTVEHEGVCEALKIETQRNNTCLEECPVPLIFDPVCGSDGKTYSNIYELECHQLCVDSSIRFFYSGECKEGVAECLGQCIIPLIYFPLCGSDGHTYSNQYELECHKNCVNSALTVAYIGKCKSAKTQPQKNDSCLEECLIPLIFDPVCGSNGKTYSNIYELNCHQLCVDSSIKFSYSGECKEGVAECLHHCAIPLIYLPVCGSDGHTYDNQFELECHKNCANSHLTIMHLGECHDRQVKVDDCVCVVPAIYAPVCGNDGNTYSNKYELACQQKCFNSDLTIAYMGECKKMRNEESKNYRSAIQS